MSQNKYNLNELLSNLQNELKLAKTKPVQEPTKGGYTAKPAESISYVKSIDKVDIMPNYASDIFKVLNDVPEHPGYVYIVPPDWYYIPQKIQIIIEDSGKNYIASGTIQGCSGKKLTLMRYNVSMNRMTKKNIELLSSYTIRTKKDDLFSQEIIAIPWDIQIIMDDKPITGGVVYRPDNVTQEVNQNESASREGSSVSQAESSGAQTEKRSRVQQNEQVQSSVLPEKTNLANTEQIEDFSKKILQFDYSQIKSQLEALEKTVEKQEEGLIKISNDMRNMDKNIKKLYRVLIEAGVITMD